MPIQTRKTNTPTTPDIIVQAIRHEYFINLFSYSHLSKRYELSIPLIRRIIHDYKHVKDSIPQHLKNNREERRKQKHDTKK